MDKVRTDLIPGQPVSEVLAVVEEALRGAALYYGHGTDNAWDEAVQLVLFAVGLAADAGDEVLSLPVSGEQLDRILQLLQQRVEHHVPLPYLTGRAWFAGLEFLCDRRALVPRSPLAELILNAFSAYKGHRI